MRDEQAVSRRALMGSVAAALGYAGVRPELLWAQTPRAPGTAPAAAPARGQQRPRMTPEEYDACAKLSSNENPYGPPESVMKAMTQAFKYSNRYGYPDGDIVQEIA